MTFSIPPLPPEQPPWSQFQVWWQQVKEKVEAQEKSQDALLAQIVAAQAAATAAQTAATAAQTTATTASTTATAVKNSNAISASHTEPGDILTATDAGTNASIVIATHVRAYDDGTSHSVTGATLTAAAYSTKFFIYYDDASRVATAPTFLKTTNASTAAYNKVTGRHYCGAITTPASGGAGTAGGSTGPGGGTEPIDYR